MKKMLFLTTCMFCAICLFAQKEHTVQAGETLESIAYKYKVSVEELSAANPNMGLVFAGIKLTIPAPSHKVQNPVETTSSHAVTTETNKKTKKSDSPKTKKKQSEKVDTCTVKNETQKQKWAEDDYQTQLVKAERKALRKARWEKFKAGLSLAGKLLGATATGLAAYGMSSTDKEGVNGTLEKLNNGLESANLFLQGKEVNYEKYNRQSSGNISTDFDAVGTSYNNNESINDLSPQERQEINKLKSKISRNIKRMDSNSTYIYLYEKEGNPKAKEKRRENKKLQKENEDLMRQMGNVWKRHREGKYSDSQNDGNVAKNTYDNKSTKKETDDDEFWTDKDEVFYKSNMKSSKKARLLVESYNESRMSVYEMKQHISHSWAKSIEERRSYIREHQATMKSRRKEYKDLIGEDIPNCSNELENWNPSDKELIW